MNAKEKEQVEYRAKLKKSLHPGDTIFCVLRHCSRSRMMRHISFFVIRGKRFEWLDYQIAKALDYPMAKDQGIKVGGCGMDMGFHMVNSLSYALHGYSKGDKPVAKYRGKEYRAGYTFKHEWV